MILKVKYFHSSLYTSISITLNFYDPARYEFASLVPYLIPSGSSLILQKPSIE
jgi:hypothetical protein